jgi:hypothetical protein
VKYKGRQPISGKENLGQGPCGRFVNRKTNREHVSSVNLVAQDRIQGRVFIIKKKKIRLLEQLSIF